MPAVSTIVIKAYDTRAGETVSFKSNVSLLSASSPTQWPAQKNEWKSASSDGRPAFESGDGGEPMGPSRVLDTFSDTPSNRR